jgi:hypothetical protein
LTFAAIVVPNDVFSMLSRTFTSHNINIYHHSGYLCQKTSELYKLSLFSTITKENGFT